MRVFTTFSFIVFLFLCKVEAKVYGFIIGVDNYVYQENLRHSKDDALLFYSTFKTINPRMDVEWNVLLDHEATPESIVAHFVRYINIIKEEDSFIFYYSGHGSDKGIYASDEYMKSGLLDYETLKLAFKYIPAKDKLIFIDACNSAAIIKENLKSYKNDQFKKFSSTRKVKKEGQNVIFFLGSGVTEQSIESNYFGHGLFTFFLCAGLLGEADFNKDNYVQIDELYYYFRNNTFATSKIISSNFQCPLLIGNFDKKLIIANLNR